MEFETVIGLEVHAQLKTKTKIFCGCPTTFGAAPNTNVCPICLGMPGVLPVLNRRVVDCALKMACATNCQINRHNEFARKNYFYPDLPKGYQISQFDRPIAEHGWVDITQGGKTSRIGLTRIHLEEDAGKLVHDEAAPVSYVDLNRAAVPLIEIVSEPDIRSPEEAVAYLKKLHAIVRYLDICDGNMQEGSFRCDANISLRPKGQQALGTRTELKNMNSFRHVQRALEYEERRQRDLLLDGGKVVQETLLWDADHNVSHSMRGKEEAHDYRYFPDPDLLPVTIADAWLARVRASLPELPDARQKRLMTDLGLPAYDAEIITSSRELADYFETALKHYANAKKLSNWMLTELLREFKGGDAADISTCKVRPQQLAALLVMIDQGAISGKIAKTVFTEMLETGHNAGQIVREKNLVQMSDAGDLVKIVKEIVAANSAQVEQFRAGKTKVMGFFIGQLMKQTKGRANPQMANELFMNEFK